MKKPVIITIAVIAAIVIIFLALPSQVPEDVTEATINEGSSGANTQAFENSNAIPIDTTTSTFEFEGFALDGKKSHVGIFQTWEGNLYKENDEIIGFSGLIQADSVKTDSGGLDNHLKNDDFFDVEVYPTIEFITTDLTDTEATGDLTFHGVTNSITFPIAKTSNTLNAEFLLDTTPFNLKYTGINKEVRLTLNLN